MLGITDYCTIAGYQRVREHFDAGHLPNLELILPNIELRLAETTREGRSINIHVITSPDIVGDLPDLLLSNLRVRYDGELYRCTWDGLVQFGRVYSNNAELEERAAFNVGASHFRVDREDIVQAFKESQRLRQNALVAVPNSDQDGNSGLRESGQRALRLEIYRMSQVILSANPADREFFLGRDGRQDPAEFRDLYGGPKPCIGGSDAHRLDDIGQPDENRHTWIKADPTFEGLLQICYEPEYRVHIGPHRPNQPIHRIDRIRIRFPEDSELSGEEGAEPFCLRGEKELLFAPGLTCVIGGRGAGKSTLLGLLQEAAVGESDFFSDKRVTSGGRRLSILDLVDLSVSSSADDIEFLDQNQIEAFALDSERLTKAVYGRLQKLDSDGNLEKAGYAVEAEVKAIELAREGVGERTRATLELQRLREDDAAERRLIASLNDEQYTGLLQRAEELNTRMSAVRSARDRLNGLIKGLEDVLSQYSTDSEEDVEEASNQYESRRAELIRAVQASIEEIGADEDLTVPSPAETDLRDRLDEVNEEISEYLDDRGISAENARDLALASDRLSGLRETISRTVERISRLEDDEADITRDPEAKLKFESAIRELIEPINELLRTGDNDELRRISIQYEFDTDAAIRSCLRALIAAENESTDGGRQLRDDYVATVCESVAWENFPQDLEELVDQIRGATSEGETTRRLCAYLSEPGEFERFKLLVESRFTDVQTFKRIEIRYDGRRLQEASFGQRCSAALFILLMMGNQPIVIDEPEAHIDSALIATLLVNLIKRRMSERQIIFATHNANFVVNGDSELVHVLSLEGEGPTQVDSTSLEDSTHRSQILRLEGGEQAFALREQRYGFSGRFS